WLIEMPYSSLHSSDSAAFNFFDRSFRFCSAMAAACPAETPPAVARSRRADPGMVLPTVRMATDPLVPEGPFLSAKMASRSVGLAPLGVDPPPERNPLRNEPAPPPFPPLAAPLG
ncbi:hypothetical protein PENTCL1PPCAC_30141, partial [Pristionchus entomophagus]